MLDTLRNDIPQSLALSAFSGTSFSPERRAESTISEYASTLTADYETFKKHAEKGETLDLLDAEFARYRAGYAKRYRAYLASSSRCVSSFIAGPSNFPAARMNKRADIAHKRLSEMLEYAERARKAIISTLRPDLRPIMSGDDNALERLQKELDQCQKLQAAMKAGNKIIRNKKLNDDQKVSELCKLGLRESTARESLKPDFCGRIGFADYQLSNNSANIRRIKQRIETISTAKETPDSTIEGQNATLDDCPADNRVRLTFPGKPSEEIRTALKKAGFRWSPTLGVWQAYRNAWSIETAKKIAG
jgi:hypothetical protein